MQVHSGDLGDLRLQVKGLECVEQLLEEGVVLEVRLLCLECDAQLLEVVDVLEVQLLCLERDAQLVEVDNGGDDVVQLLRLEHNPASRSR